MAQVFRADPETAQTYPNGAVGLAPGGPMDCIGHYAVVRNCPIYGTADRLTCYATGYADTVWTVPACTRKRGKHVKGYFTHEAEGPVFHPMNDYKHLFNAKQA